jgi:Papain fold toxin 2
MGNWLILSLPITYYPSKQVSDIFPHQPHGAELRERIAKIASRYKNFQWVECAQAIKDFLSEQGVHGKHIKIYTGTSQSPYGYILY